MAPGLGQGGLERIVRDLGLASRARGDAVVVCCTAKLGIHADALRASGIEVRLCRGSLPGLPGVVLKLASALRRFRPDIVHSHGGAWLAAALAGKLAARSAALIHTEHGRQDLGRWRARAERWCAANTGRITAVTAALALEMQRATGRRIETVPNGVDPPPPKTASDARGLRAELGLSAEDLLVVAIGRLEPVKDHSLLLRAIALARRTAPRLSAVVLGAGSLESRLEDEARGLGIEKQVRFLGFLPDPSRWLEAADVFALPSRSEGLPLALLEAMARGLPIVCCRLPGLMEALGQPPAGVLVEPGDAAAFAGALAGLAADAVRRRELGSRARVRSRDFSLQKMIDRYFALYEEAAP